MKKIFIFIAVIMSCHFGMCEEYFMIDSIYYRTLGACATVTSCPSNRRVISIPTTVTYNGISYLVTEIGNQAFMGKSNLVSITIPDSVLRIGDSSFEYCTSLNSVHIGKSVRSIGDWAFYNCYSLRSITLPKYVQSIGFVAFSGCTSLVSIDMSDAIQSIGVQAFYSCTNLKSIEIPNSVKKIGYQAFQICTNLESVVIGNSLKRIEMETFWGCSKLKSLTIGPSVKTIERGAFGNCTSLNSLVIPNSVDSIGQAAFASCSGLNSVIFGNSIRVIGQEAFCHCTGLTSLFIPNSVTTIGTDAFLECTSLTNLTLSGSVTDISNAFQYCRALDTITSFDTIPPSTSVLCFIGIDTSISVYVPVNSIDAYKKAIGWKDFTNINPIKADIVSTEGDVKVHALEVGVILTWPKTETATMYTLEIRYNSALVSMFSFDQQGVLTDFSFPTLFAPARGEKQDSHYATATATGWTYTIIGLETNTDYTYTLVVKDNYGNVLDTQTGSFQTAEEKSTIEYTVTTFVNDEAMGTVTGGGTFDEGQSVTLIAVANDGYRFVRWDNNETDNPFTFTLRQDVTITAIFEEVCEGIDEVKDSENSKTISQKFLQNGKLFIRHGDKLYNVVGLQLK